MSDLIFVRSTGKDAGRVTLWEIHPNHPDGELFVFGDGVFSAAKTPAVMSRVGSGHLEIVEQPKQPADRDKPASATKKQDEKEQ